MSRSTRKIVRAGTMVSQIGISVLVPIFLCVYAGVWIDGKIGTGYWTIILMVLGIMAAFRNIYRLTKGFYAKDKKKEDAELKYLEDLKKGNLP